MGGIGSFVLLVLSVVVGVESVFNFGGVIDGGVTNPRGGAVIGGEHSTSFAADDQYLRYIHGSVFDRIL